MMDRPFIERGESGTTLREAVDALRMGMEEGERLLNDRTLGEIAAGDHASFQEYVLTILRRHGEMIEGIAGVLVANGLAEQPRADA